MQTFFYSHLHSDSLYIKKIIRHDVLWVKQNNLCAILHFRNCLNTALGFRIKVFPHLLLFFCVLQEMTCNRTVFVSSLFQGTVSQYISFSSSLFRESYDSTCELSSKQERHSSLLQNNAGLMNIRLPAQYAVVYHEKAMCHLQMSYHIISLVTFQFSLLLPSQADIVERCLMQPLIQFCVYKICLFQHWRSTSGIKQQLNK